MMPARQVWYHGKERVMLGQEGNGLLTSSARVPKLPRIGFLSPLGYVQRSFGKT